MELYLLHISPCFTVADTSDGARMHTILTCDAGKGITLVQELADSLDFLNTELDTIRRSRSYGSDYRLADE